MKVAIFIADSNGCYPVPAINGGAVSTLVESLAFGNNLKKCMELTIVTYYDRRAMSIANKKLPNVNFKYIRIPYVVKMMDSMVFFLVKTFFKNKKVISYRSVFSLLYYIVVASIFLRKQTFDKVVLENNIPLAWIIRLSRYSGDFYYHFHNVPRINAHCKAVFDKCTKYLCVSEFVAKQITSSKSSIGKIPKEKIEILFNCIDTDLFKPLDSAKTIRKNICKKYGINEHNNIILFVGRLSSEKGIDKVLEAMEICQKENITLLVVGSLMHNLKIKDDYQNKLYNISGQLGNRVVFTGYVSQLELPNFYNAVDKVILPSMWEEPAGLTMVEALACGASVVTTVSGGIPEYVSNYAVLLPKKNIVTGIIEEINKVTLKDAFEQREYIVKNFSRENYIVNFFNSIGSN